MAIALKNYAKALVETAEGASPEELSAVLKNFIKTLKEHDRLEDLAAITQFVEEYYKENPRFSVKAQVEYAGANPEAEILKLLKEQHPDKEVYLECKKNPALIAGSRILVDGELVDYSLKNQLQQFKKKVARNSQ